MTFVAPTTPFLGRRILSLRPLSGSQYFENCSLGSSALSRNSFGIRNVSLMRQCCPGPSIQFGLGQRLGIDSIRTWTIPIPKNLNHHSFGDRIKALLDTMVVDELVSPDQRPHYFFKSKMSNPSQHKALLTPSNSFRRTLHSDSNSARPLDATIDRRHQKSKLEFSLAIQHLPLNSRLL